MKLIRVRLLRLVHKMVILISKSSDPALREIGKELVVIEGKILAYNTPIKPRVPNKNK